VAFYIIPKSEQNFCFEQYDARLNMPSQVFPLCLILVLQFFGHENVINQKIGGEEFTKEIFKGFIMAFAKDIK
jgi:hypothetical protein